MEREREKKEKKSQKRDIMKDESIDRTIIERINKTDNGKCGNLI